MKPSILLLCIAGAAVIGGFQHHRLSKLDEEIELRATSSTSANDPNEASDESESRLRSTRRAALDVHSMAGQESIPELIDLVSRLGQKMKAGRNGSRWINVGAISAPDGPDLLRLQALLAALGAGAAERFFDSLTDLTAKCLAREAYGQVNPEQALFYCLKNPTHYQQGEPYPGTISPISCFHSWAFLDPSGALAWYRRASKEGPVMSSDSMRLEVSIAKSRVDPAGSVADLIQILRQKPPHLTKSDIREMCQYFSHAMHGDDEFISFFTALKPAPGDSGETPYLSDVREQVYLWIERPLVKKSFADASSIIDQLTPAEKLKFAKAKPPASGSDPQESAAWAAWEASLDVPAAQRHPLVNHVETQAYRATPTEPDWLKTLPPGELRTRVTSSYVAAVVYKSPALAARWLQDVPPGSARSELATTIADEWQKSDPAAAAAFSQQESESTDAK